MSPGAAYTCELIYRYACAALALERLTALGIRAWVVDDDTVRLACAPGGMRAITPTLERELHECKYWLVQLLRERRAN